MHPGAIDDLAAAVCADRTISEQQLRALLDLPAGGDAQHALQAAAVRIRRHFRGDRLSFCSILNAKGGRCSEDCRYCGQARGVEAAVTDWLEDAQIRAAAADCAATGAWALSLVAAWRGLRAPARVAMVCRSIAAVADSGIRADASLGLIEADGIAEELRAAGLRVYHHNLETARSHFPHTCSTHGWADRLATIERVQG
ncbi:MAG: radical SAM protein, partial [Planctomycetota bacterium]